MAIQKVNESLMPHGPIETMKRNAQESVKPEAPGTQRNEQLQRFKEENKGFKIDTKA